MWRIFILLLQKNRHIVKLSFDMMAWAVRNKNNMLIVGLSVNN